MISLQEHWRRVRLKELDARCEQAERQFYGRRQFVRGLACAPLLMLPTRFAVATPAQQMMTGAGGCGDATTDANYASVSVLLHFENNTTDSGPAAQTMSGLNSTNNATNFKFGANSRAFVRANSSYLQTDLQARWQFGTGDITVEAWVFNALVGANGIFSTSPASGPSGNYGVSCYNSDNTFYIYETWAVEVCHWSSVAQSAGWNNLTWVRSSGAWAFYYNGVAQSKTITGGNENRNYQRNFGCIGQFYSDVTLATTYGLNTSIDEVRVTKGVARYTSNFTPACAAFPNSA